MRKAIQRNCFGRELSLEKCMEAASEAGFDGIELSFREGSEITFDITEEEAGRIKRNADGMGLRIPSFTTGAMWKYPLTSPDPGIAQKSRDIVKKALEVCSVLGADTLLVVPGIVTEDVPYITAYGRAGDAIAELAGTAEKQKVFIGIENVSNKMLLNPVEMKTFIEEVDSPYVGAYLDAANTLATGFPEDWINTLGKHIRKVHVKDYDAGARAATYMLQGEVRWDSVMAALKAVGYDDYLVAELNPYKTCPEEIAYSTARAIDAVIGRFYDGK